MNNSSKWSGSFFSYAFLFASVQYHSLSLSLSLFLNTYSFCSFIHVDSTNYKQHLAQTIKNESIENCKKKKYKKKKCIRDCVNFRLSLFCCKVNFSFCLCWLALVFSSTRCVSSLSLSLSAFACHLLSFSSPSRRRSSFFSREFNN